MKKVAPIEILTTIAFIVLFLVYFIPLCVAVSIKKEIYNNNKISYLFYPLKWINKKWINT